MRVSEKDMVGFDQLPVIHEFAQSAEVGKAGVIMVEDYLRSRGIEFDNVEDSKLYQKRDIDLVLRKKTTHFKTIEVKTDLRVGNFFLETMSNQQEDVLGWVYKSEADVIFYVIPKERLLFALPLAPLREICLEPYMAQYIRVAKNADGWRRNPKGYTFRKTIGLAVPYSVLLAELKDRGHTVWRVTGLEVSEEAAKCLGNLNDGRLKKHPVVEIDYSQVHSLPELGLIIRKW